MGKTVTKKYEADNGDIHPIRLSTGVAGITGNTEPSGSTTSDISAEVSKSGRTLGLHARYVTAYKTVGTAPDTFHRFQKFTILQKSVFDGNTFKKGATFTYGGDTWTVSGKENETVK